MTVEAHHTPGEGRNLAGHATKRVYESLCLIDLARLIVENADDRALYELHSRREVFVLNDGRSLLLAEYLSLLKLLKLSLPVGNDARSIALAERAYDLTLDKFMNLPTESGRNGPDCRHYFGAFLAAMDRSLQRHPAKSRLEREARSGVMLKGLVARQFNYSSREAIRESDPFWSRYQWCVDARSLTLWMPSVMSGAERRAWLEENIPLEFIGQPNERKLIQGYIEKNLVKGHFIPLDALENNQEISQGGFSFSQNEDWGLSLADVVAQEKAENIDKQRRAIRKMGPENLATMVRQIFLDLDAEEYEQKRIAKQFGLSPATLSRFAGTDWRQKDTQDRQIPDLWRNTAQVVSQIPMFREVAEEVGMLHRIEEVRGDE